jgi:hypothetical protein
VILRQMVGGIKFTKNLAIPFSTCRGRSQDYHFALTWKRLRYCLQGAGCSATRQQMSVSVILFDCVIAINRSFQADRLFR